MEYKENQLIIYKNGDRYEIGKIKRIVNENTAAVWYHSGDTAARTNFHDMRPIINEYSIEDLIKKES